MLPRNSRYTHTCWLFHTTALQSDVNAALTVRQMEISDKNTILKSCTPKYLWDVLVKTGICQSFKVTSVNNKTINVLDGVGHKILSLTVLIVPSRLLWKLINAVRQNNFKQLKASKHIIHKNNTEIYHLLHFSKPVTGFRRKNTGNNLSEKQNQSHTSHSTVNFK